MIILKLVRGILSSDYVNLYYGWTFKLYSQSRLERPSSSRYPELIVAMTHM